MLHMTICDLMRENSPRDEDDKNSRQLASQLVTHFNSIHHVTYTCHSENTSHTQRELQLLVILVNGKEEDHERHDAEKIC